MSLVVAPVNLLVFVLYCLSIGMFCLVSMAACIVVYGEESKIVLALAVMSDDFEEWLCISVSVLWKRKR